MPQKKIFVVIVKLRMSHSNCLIMFNWLGEEFQFYEYIIKLGEEKICNVVSASVVIAPLKLFRKSS